MTKFIVDLDLDGYDTKSEMDAACKVFIHDQLNMTSSGVSIEDYVEPLSKRKKPDPALEILENRIQAKYNSVDRYIKEDVGEAIKWAKETLTKHEGDGHSFYISSRQFKDSGHWGVCCSFAKPEWGGDHCSRAMQEGSEAVVMAVCEYLCGA